MAGRTTIRDATVAGYPGAHPGSRSEAGGAGGGRRSGGSIANDPGVGPRLAEAMVALIDDPHRFKRARDVGAYLGLVPRQYQSGEMNRLCRITKRGSKLLRSLLVEVSWVSLRHNPWLRSLYERMNRGSKTRKKIAIVAVARHLAIYCWAMLRDGTTWRQPCTTQ